MNLVLVKGAFASTAGSSPVEPVRKEQVVYRLRDGLHATRASRHWTGSPNPAQAFRDASGGPRRTYAFLC